MRRGPQDVPYAPPLLAVVLAVYAALSLAMHAMGGNAFHALAQMVLDVGLTLAATALLLRMAGYGARWVQTMTALAGSGVLLTLMAFPVAAAMTLTRIEGGGRLSLGVALLVLMVWSVMVSGVIYARALEVHRVAGIGIAMLLLIVAALLSKTLLY